MTETNDELVTAAINAHRDWLMQQAGVTGCDQCFEGGRTALRVFHGGLDDETKAAIEAKIAPAPVVWHFLPEISAH